VGSIQPNTQSEIINESREIKKELIAVKRQITGSVTFGVMGAGIILGIISGLFSIIFSK
jgi:predicted Co/Zn/Cd cation transporter (cation efflux family)